MVCFLQVYSYSLLHSILTDKQGRCAQFVESTRILYVVRVWNEEMRGARVEMGGARVE